MVILPEVKLCAMRPTWAPPNLPPLDFPRKPGKSSETIPDSARRSPRKNRGHVPRTTIQLIEIECLTIQCCQRCNNKIARARLVDSGGAKKGGGVSDFHEPRFFFSSSSSVRGQS